MKSSSHTKFWLTSYTRSDLNIIQYDVAGYYSYLPSIVIYKDIKKLKWRDKIKKSYSVEGINEVASPHVSGNQVMKYSIGMSISYLPGFAIAHLYSVNNPDVKADGFSAPYHLGLIIIGWLYMLIALWYFRKLLSIYYEDWIVAFTLGIIAIGTNYFIYAGSHSMMPHSFMFMLYSLVLYNTILWYENQNYFRIMLIGALIGLITITRPTGVLITMVVLLWGVHHQGSLKKRFQTLVNRKKQVSIAIVISALIISIQLCYWKYVTGNWIVYSYKDEGFTWDGRYLKECFLGFRKGWLIYTPVMIISILGLFVMRKNKKSLIIWKPILLFFLINTYIIFSWDNYWYGGGFGQRAMISSYVILAFPMSSWIQYISKKSIFLKIATALFIVSAISLNIFQTFQAQIWGGFETTNMTKNYYLKIFGKHNINPDWKIYLDNKDAKLGEINNSTLLFENRFNDESGSSERLYKETKTIKIIEKGLHVLLDTTITNLNKNQLLRAELMVSGNNRVWNRYEMSSLHIQLFSKGNEKSNQKVKLHDISRDSTWQSIHVDVKVRHDDIDQLKVSVWSNLENNFVFLDDLRVSSID